MILQVILACVICFAITAVAGKLLIPELVKLKAGQSIKEIGPTWHMTKQGTPTMGGLMFIIGIGITVVILGWKGMVQGDFTHIYVYLFALVFGVIGYIDDYQKVKASPQHRPHRHSKVPAAAGGGGGVSVPAAGGGPSEPQPVYSVFLTPTSC